MRRPYFTRVWVLQELHLANKVSCCCGSTVQSFRHLPALNTLFEFWMEDYTFTKCTDHLRVVLRKVPFIRRSHAVRSTYPDFREIRAARGCLVLAFKELVFQELTTLLIDIQDFLCADVRDKLYGILSLIDWGRGPTPTPDYSKDNFQVAVDAFSAITRCGNRVNLEPNLYFARWMLELFAVTPHTASLCQAIGMRSGRCEKDMLPRFQKLHIIAEPWLGVKIRDHHDHQDGLEEDDTKIPQLWREQKMKFSTLRSDRHGPVSIFAPMNTRANDWYISARWYRPSDIGGHATELILRRSTNGRYTFIGPTRSAADVTNEYMGATRVVQVRAAKTVPKDSFQAFWQPEDLLVLTWRLYQITFNRALENQTSGFVNTRICAFQDSSYCTKVFEDDT
jgi:hypothetical protein